MISKQAVQEFLDRPRDSFDWIKDASREELIQAIKELCPTFNPKIKLFTHQLSSLYLGLCFDGFLYFLDMGLGKEQPLTSKILTPSGWKLMGDIKQGDVLCHPNGKTTTVINIFPQGMKDVYKVTFTDGSTTECGEEHLWTVTTPRMKCQGRGYRTWPLSRIKQRLRDTSNNLVHFIPMTQPVMLEDERKESFVIHPYALGCLIGDGGLSSGGISLTKGDKELFTLVEQYFPDTLMFSNLEGITQNIKRTSRKILQNTWVDEIRRLNLNTKSNAKHLPKEYLFSSVENRIALLQGLMDTDGYVALNGDSTQWSTSSEQLCNDFTFLVQSLGGTARSKIKVVNEKNYWIVTLTLKNTFPLFRLTRKKLRWEQRQGKYQPRRGIKEVTLIGKKECQCISVSEPDGLYITDDFIVTHNTLIALNTIQCRKNLKQIKRSLVVVPNLVNIESWLEEIESKTNLTAIGLSGTKEERTALLNQQASVFIVNYDGLPIFTTDFKEVKSKKAQRKRVINKKLLRAFATRFQMVVYDEIHHVKHTNTLTYQICDGLSDFIPYRLGMTGTPIGRDPSNFWAQFHTVDRGETLGTNKTIFLQALFKQQANYWGGVQWIFPEKNKPILHKMLAHRSIRYSDNECADLPPVSIIKIPLKLSPEAQTVYRNLVLESIEQAKENTKDSQQTRKNYYSKTRQVASGFMYEDVDSERVTLTFNNPKLDALEEILEDVPTDCKVVIFHVFNQSGLDIVARLKKLKIKYAAMNVVAEGSKVDEYKKFKQDKNTKVLVVNIASGGEGLNLQDANYCIFYENTDNPATYRQALKRCHRTGQEKHVYIYQFYMKNTVEMKIMEFLEEGKNLFAALVDGKTNIKDILGG